MIDKKKYSELLAMMESNNNYTATNSIGALGKYQFTPSTLNDLRDRFLLTNWNNANYFLSNPVLQELYFDAHYKNSLKQISINGFDKHIGEMVRGSMRFKNIEAPLNEYGLLAGIHLSGAGNVREHFQNGHDPNDGNTSLTDYMAYFSSKLQNIISPLYIILAFIPAIVLYYS